ncbi:MAG: prepilin-type N-terminal cleavage/methylation domain-containing protein [Nocardioides sp.]
MSGRSDAGETLVEVLVTVVILGLAGVAVAGGLALSARASDMHRKETTGGAYVRSFAEAIQEYVGADHYRDCAGADFYTAKVTLALPSGFTASQDKALSIGPTGAAATCTTDPGIQRVTLHVASSDGRATESLTVLLRKPCDPSVAACTA